ncbi:MAG: serine/threonine protein kinase [Gammaproteobacteria bacterium]|nr:serine/threonine protein kinase [Gammaproteobacteria bacterium]
MTSDETTPYSGLTPDLILDALEATGFSPSGSLLELNSYENRVYQLGLEDDSFVVTKFYRPARWSNEQILEEHTFTQELIDHELPAVGPLVRDGTTLFDHQGFRFAVFPRQGGHPPNIEIVEDLKVLSRTLGRMHSVGSVAPFATRPSLSVERLGVESRTFLLEHQFIPLELEPAYSSITEHLLERLTPQFDDVGWRRIHGDCHLGNLLWRNDLPHFVDFDDCVNGPPIQDLWMLLSGERDEREAQLGIILKAYEQFATFDLSSLRLVEPLRTLRIMYHAAWIARRWDDPAFPRAFPWFNTEKYWSEHILNLREQQAALEEPSLIVS